MKLSNNKQFSHWLNEFCRRAALENIPNEIIQRFYRSIKLNSDVIEKSRKQPEFDLSAQEYISKLVSSDRVAHGKDAISLHPNMFNTLNARFGVDKFILTAIWGIESNYGKRMGEYSTIDSLATLAFSGSRREFWEKELIAALQIYASGDAPSNHYFGSWAGAMGHTQFMPSSYLSDGISLNGTRCGDIWGCDPSDALASTANYLLRRDWDIRLPWGSVALLPKNFDYSLSGYWNLAPSSTWEKAQLKLIDGVNFTDWGESSLILPSGHMGPAFLVTRNFAVLMKYNVSILYALAAGLLATAIQTNNPHKLNWPNIAPLQRVQIQEMQRLLVQLGHNTGGIDGISGAQTLQSVQNQQLAMGEIPDGFPDLNFIEKLKHEIRSG